MAFMKKSITIDQALKRTMTLFQAFTHMIIFPRSGASLSRCHGGFHRPDLQPYQSGLKHKN